MAKARNAGILKLNMPAHSSYPRQSADQDAIEEYIKQHGVKKAVNSGKVFSFNGNSGRKKRGARL